MICKDCGKEFELPEKEVKWFKDRGLETPKRCKECRITRREEKENQIRAKRQ